jgi:hypothetical protein
MATQDDYIKTALRLPRNLHSRLINSAQQTGKSMNAEMIARLSASFDAEARKPKKETEALAAQQADLQKIVEGLQTAIEQMARQIKQR